MSFTRKDFNYFFLLLIRFYGFLEVFVFSGIQMFWVMYNGDLVQYENLWDALALIPLFFSVTLIGILSRLKKYYKSLQKIEYVFHFIISLCGIALILIFQFQDKLNPGFFFSWDFFLWIFFQGFILVSNVIRNLDKVSLPNLVQKFVEEKTKSNWIMLIITIIITWIPGFLLMKNSDYIMVFWISTILYHSILVPISLHQTKSPDLNFEINAIFQYNTWKEMIKNTFDWTNPDTKKKIYHRLHLFLNGFSSFFSIIACFYLWVFSQEFLGAIEEHHSLYTSIFISPLFYLGGLIAILSYKKSLLGDFIVINMLLLGLFEIYLFIPCVLGYTLIKIVIRATTQTPTKYASTIIGMNLAFFIATYIFVLSGLLLSEKNLLINILVGFSCGAFFISLIFYGMDHILHSKNQERRNI